MKVIKGSVLTQANVSDRRVARSTAHAIAQMHRGVKLAPDETAEVFSRQTGDFLRLTPENYSKIETQSRALSLQIPSRKELFLELEEAKKTTCKRCRRLLMVFNSFLKAG